MYTHFSGLVTPVIDLSDLLRAELVLIVSALDQFIHELTRLGMMEIWKGEREITPSYQKFAVSLEVMIQLANDRAGHHHLEAEIRRRHSFLSFQQPDKIADAIRLISAVELWDAIAELMNQDVQNVKSQLGLIVERRNKIAHEADIDPSYPDQRWPISPDDTEDALRFIESVGESIFKVTA